MKALVELAEAISEGEKASDVSELVPSISEGRVLTRPFQNWVNDYLSSGSETLKSGGTTLSVLKSLGVARSKSRTIPKNFRTGKKLLDF